MADPQQQYTSAQLSDGRTLQFIGNLSPDEVRTKVQQFRAREALSNPANAPAVPRPQVNMQTVFSGTSDPTLETPETRERNYLRDPNSYGISDEDEFPGGAKEESRSLEKGILRDWVAPAMTSAAGSNMSLLWQSALSGAGGALGAKMSGASNKGSLAWGAAGAALPFLPKAVNAIPSKDRAGQAFQAVMGAAQNNAVQTTPELSQAMSRYQELVDGGGSRSVSVSKLMSRLTDPNKGPLTYKEARDFYSNISRLSADEAQRLTPVMKQQVGAVRAALGSAIQGTANQAGVGQQYAGAMKEFAQRSRLNAAGQVVGDYATKKAADMLPWLAMGYAAKKAYSGK